MIQPLSSKWLTLPHQVRMILAALLGVRSAVELKRLRAARDVLAMSPEELELATAAEQDA